VARPGFELPLLLVTGFRAVVDELHDELAARGHPEARPVHGFALQAIGAEGVSISELGRRLGVSKQAAAKTARALERLGYARRVATDDARVVLLVRTDRGAELLALSAETFDRIRQRWERIAGSGRVGELEDVLRTVTGDATPRLDLPGWLGA
jgi:DNA-binding MarR family transcriptional regulator